MQTPKDKATLAINKAANDYAIAKGVAQEAATSRDNLTKGYDLLFDYWKKNFQGTGNDNELPALVALTATLDGLTKAGTGITASNDTLDRAFNDYKNALTSFDLGIYDVAEGQAKNSSGKSAISTSNINTIVNPQLLNASLGELAASMLMGYFGPPMP